MEGFKNIFLAFDGSPDSIEALRTAEFMTKRTNANLTVGYVHSPSLETAVTPGATQNSDPSLYQSHVYMGPFPAPSIGTQHRIMETSTQDDTPDKIISDAELRLTNLLDVDYEILSGKPVNAILNYTKNHDTDLIIMGNRGISGIKKFVMGSVSKKVVEEADCPVLVVK
ncbi:universal stress protein [Ornithinibacillus contaminans]|uniref:universal stress protein n=1 Tax=Ornithinibacillus contaminans TaxID=694055 RepID=UPI00069CC184|nr:universal stress protein [Ornithinibacillus contaminans]